MRKVAKTILNESLLRSMVVGSDGYLYAVTTSSPVTNISGAVHKINPATMEIIDIFPTWAYTTSLNIVKITEYNNYLYLITFDGLIMKIDLFDFSYVDSKYGVEEEYEGDTLTLEYYDMITYDGYIYVSALLNYTSWTNDNMEWGYCVLKIDPDTLEILNHIEFEDKVNSIVGIEDNIYAGDDNKKLHIINPTTFNISDYIDVGFKFLILQRIGGGSLAAGEIKELGYLFAGTASNMIYKIDPETIIQ